MSLRLIALSTLFALTACFDPVHHAPKSNWETHQNHATTQTIYQARVVAVSDGDTIHVIDRNGQKRKIRMAYIDAPELQQAHSEASRENLTTMIEGQTVEVTVFERDRYQREVAQVRLNGRDVNLAQLENGHAWHYVSIAKKKQSKTDYQVYGQAELNARSKRLGLWHAKNPQAPWHFRKEQRQNAQ
ncbi:thermonuclease family protein [Neisseria wadsworthii]|uniref:Thermonuclease n=1 Tax=Neisseria wadsworthii 9715 TaxID=1030841 RepID=G4CS84_9NEIS|nr:thermonuclease family protein [Neisseria wadsworthii]EGZ44829.1 thermonuclease [Neisseria wadsworthii 9715]QMT35589.1 thermonuclease family protein [Neisseria wadsworthii]